MKTHKVILGVVAVVFWGISGAIGATKPSADGADFMKITHDQRVMFVAGVYAGLMTVPSMMGYDDNSRRVAAEFGSSLERGFQGIDVNTMCARLETFYQDKRNRRVLVGPLMVVLSLQGRASREQMAAAIGELRAKTR